MQVRLARACGEGRLQWRSEAVPDSSGSMITPSRAESGNPLRHGVDIKAPVDAETGHAQPAQPFPRDLDLSRRVVLSVTSSTSSGTTDGGCSRPSRIAERVPRSPVNRRIYVQITHTSQELARER